MMFRFSPIILSFFLLFSSFGGLGQVIQPDSHTRDYYDLVAFMNPEMPRPIAIHPSIVSQYRVDSVLEWNIWGSNFDMPMKKSGKSNWAWVSPYFDYSYNAKTPRGYNDGAIWSGKGSNLAISGGFMGNWGILHVSFVPIISTSQNKDIVIPDNVTNAPVSPYSYPFSSEIDWVQQYGEGFYSQFNWGQSEIRLVYKNMTLGFSTENFKWGPSIWQPILMSTNAAGIPHFDFGTAAPIETKVGKFEGKWYWGEAKESNYFDADPINDRKYITGFSLGFEPKLLPGLSVGLNRVMYTRWAEGDLSGADFFAALAKNKADPDGGKNDEYDQMASVIVKYRFPTVGFEVYMEYARNDFPGNFNDAIEKPDRSRGMVLGAMKVFKLFNDNLLKVSYEYSSVSMNQLLLTPSIGVQSYYIHTEVPNGYTHQGQVLGAGMGPGSNSDLIKVDIFNPKGKIGFLFSRIRFNDDYFLSKHKNLPEPYPNDYEASLGVDYVRYFKHFSFRPQFMWNYRKNWYYQDEITISNWHFGLQVQYFIR